jgi:hypothetical protein
MQCGVLWPFQATFGLVAVSAGMTGSRPSLTAHLSNVASAPKRLAIAHPGG